MSKKNDIMNNDIFNWKISDFRSNHYYLIKVNIMEKIFYSIIGYQIFRNTIIVDKPKKVKKHSISGFQGSCIFFYRYLDFFISKEKTATFSK